MSLLIESYEQGECPDCDLKIKESSVDGDECENCGHVFYEEHPTEENT